MKLLSHRIAVARGEANLSRERLARQVAATDTRLAGTNSLTVYRWENGTRPRFETETIAAIAQATGKPYAFFFESEEGEQQTPDDDEEAAPVSVTFTGSPEVVADLMGRLKLPVPEMA